MGTQRAMQPPAESGEIAKLRSQYGCGPVEFAGTANALYERHLVFDDVIDVAAAGPRERFAAVTRSLRYIVSQQWIRTGNIFQGFSYSDLARAVAETFEAESFTRVVSPDDPTSMGQRLRFVQEYFLVT